MQLIWFGVMLLCLYGGVILGFHVWFKRHTSNQFPIKLPGVVAGFLASAFLLGLASCHIIFNAPRLSGFTMVVFLVLATLFLSAKWSEQKKIWLPIMCCAGSYAACKIFPAIPFELITYLLMSFSWLLVAALVIFFDCLPFLSFFTVAAWAIAFALRVFTNGLVPPELAVLLWLLVVPLWATLRVSAQEMQGSLGPYGGAFLGYMMGGIIALCVGFGAYSSALTLISYYLFEYGMFALPFLGMHLLGMHKGDFAYMIALCTGKPERIIKTVFYHLVVLALVAVLVWKAMYIWFVVVIILIVLLDVYNRYKLCGQPEPSIRQLWRETKLSFQELCQQFKLSRKAETENSVENHQKLSKSKSGFKTTHQVKRKKKK